MNAVWPAAAAGAVVTAGCAAVLVSARAKLRSLVESGHHAGFEVNARPGHCGIRTTNPRIAQELAARHADWLANVR